MVKECEDAKEVVIERAGNITKHGHEAIKAICGTDEEYKAYVKKYSEDGICPKCNKHKIRCYAEAMYFNPEDSCKCQQDTKNELGGKNG